jgi:transcriptional regulator with XRE-family HTH domain
MKKTDLAVLTKFGGAIRVRRYALGVTQMKLAELVGCSLQAIGNIERGQANPSLIMVYRIARALKICPKELIP